MADDLDLHRLAPAIDGERTRLSFERRRRRSRAVRRGVLTGAAAAVVVVAMLTAGFALRGDDESLKTGQDPDPALAEVTFDVLSRAEATEPMGTLLAATSSSELDALWSRSGTAGAPPQVDFDERAVVSITIPDDACPPELDRFGRSFDEIVPVFIEPDGACILPLIPKTYVVTVEWGPLGDAFTVHLPDPGVEAYFTGHRRLRVVRPGASDPESSTEDGSRTGTIEGTFLAVGGRYPGTALELSGEVRAVGADGTSHEVGAIDGAFTLVLPPGTYTIIGSSPQYNAGQPCEAASDVELQGGEATTAQIFCQMR